MKNFTLLVSLWLALPIFLSAQCPVGVDLPERTICYGSVSGVNIGVSSADPSLRYFWSPTTGLSNPSSAYPTANPSVTTTYTLSAFGAACGGFVTIGTVTVHVAGLIYVTAPNGNIVRGTDYTDLYFPAWASGLGVTLNSDVPGDWYIYPSTLASSGSTSYTYTFSNTASDNESIYITTYDDQSNLCSYTDIRTIATHPCYNTTDFPVTVTAKYFQAACSGDPTLPATVSQYTGLGGGTTYDWSLFASGNWSLSSSSGSSVTLGHSTTTSPDSATLYTRASNPSYFGGLGQEYWMLWGVKFVYPACSLVRPGTSTRTPAGFDDGSVTAAVFPNPASSFVTITAGEPISQLEITSLAGSTLRRIQTGGVKTYTLSTGDLPSGTYVARLLLEGKKIRFVRFVVQK